ncbi:hypothetical protein PIB30_041782 [Stylosanthes scabra]|uniref:Uncharacterized protein n=1 Tax=Stylosanthes scabra TaxID=79078 RepID=A0ABU6VGJ3_9FABA|nr:hypothetical protein [Stylosanthes scabra]
MLCIGTTTDGARVSGILHICEDGMTCSGVGNIAGWYCSWPLGVCSLPVSISFEDGELPEVHPRVARRRRASVQRGRGRGRPGPNGSPVRADEPMEGVHANEAPEFDFGMTNADFLSLGLPGPSHPTPDTQAGPSHSAPPMMQLQIEVPLPVSSEQFVPPHVYHPQASTPDLDQIPENYTQWCAEMFGQSSYQPMLDHSSWGTPIQQSEPFAHISDSVPPSAYEARRTKLSDSEDSGDAH